MNEYPYVQVYRGIQKPLEFMGLRGRYVYVAVGTVFSAIILFIILYLVFGLLVAFVLVLIILLCASVWIYTNQKKGLHSKKAIKTVYIVNSLFIQK